MKKQNQITAEDRVNFFSEVWAQKLKDFIQEYKPNSNLINKNIVPEEHKFIFY